MTELVERGLLVVSEMGQAAIALFPEGVRAYLDGMNALTKGFLTSQLLFFLWATTWYLGRMFVRRVHLPLARWHIEYLAKKPEDEIDEAREEAAGRMFRVWGLGRWAKDPFQEFVRAWKDARPAGAERAILPVRLRDFLTPEIVIDRAANQRTCDALPGIFLAIGIFGTFLGLVTGLMDLKLGGEVTQMEEGVRRLVEGLSLAFLTSLVGILSSVLFTAFHKHGVRALRLAVEALDRSVARLFPYESEELSARRLLEDQAEIRRQLQTLATDIGTHVAQTIAPAMENAVGQHLVPVLKSTQELLRESLQELLHRFTDHATQTQDEAFRRMAEFVGALQQSFEQQIHGVAQIIQAASQAQDETFRRMAEHATRLQGSFEEQIQSVAHIIRETSQAQGRVQADLVEFGDQLRQQVTLQMELIDRTSEASRLLNESLQGLRNVTGELAASASQISSSAEHLADSARLAREGQQELRVTIEQQVEALRATRSDVERAWQTITEQTQSIVEHLSGLIDRLSDALGQSLQGALGSFDEALAEAIRRFSGTLHEWQEVMEELPGTLSALSRNVDDMARETRALASAVEAARSVTADLSGPLREQLSDVAAALTRAAEAAGQHVGTVLEWPDRAGEILGRHLQGLESWSNRAERAAFERWENTRAELSRLTEALAALGGRAEQSTGALREASERMVDALSGELRDVRLRLDALVEKAENAVSWFRELAAQPTGGAVSTVGARNDGEEIRLVAERLGREIRETATAVTLHVADLRNGFQEAVRNVSQHMHAIHQNTQRVTELLEKSGRRPKESPPEAPQPAAVGAQEKGEAPVRKPRGLFGRILGRR